MAAKAAARSDKVTVDQGLVTFLGRAFIGAPATPQTFVGEDAGHGLARDIFSAMNLKAGQDLEKVYSLVTYYAKQAFVICARARDDEAGRETALAALCEHYLRARMAHQILTACEFLGHCRPDPAGAANEDIGYAALRLHPAVAAGVSRADALDALLPDAKVSAAAKSAPKTIYSRFLEQQVASPGAPLGPSPLQKLDAPNLVPERWGVDLHDAYGVQEGLNALSQSVAEGLGGFNRGGGHFGAVLAAVNAIEEIGEDALDQNLAELKAFFSIPYDEQTIFAARQQFERARTEAGFPIAQELSGDQLAFLGLSLLNGKPPKASFPAHVRRTMRIEAIAALFKSAPPETVALAQTNPVLDAQLRDLAARTTEYLDRQFEKRPVSLTQLARARRDFQTLEFDVLSDRQMDETDQFREQAERLHASSVKSDESLIAMALCESEIKVFEQIEGWMIEHLHPFLSSHGAVGQAERKVATGACDIAVRRMLKRIEDANADVDAALPEDAVENGASYAYPFMSLAHVDAARLAGAAARLIRYISPDEGAESRKLLAVVRQATLLNGQQIYEYAHGFFEASLKQFLKDDGADLRNWTRLAEQTRVYAALLEILDTDFLHNESPKYLKEIDKRIRDRLKDGKRPAQTPQDATQFLKLAMISMKISRNNTVLDAFAFQTPDGRYQIPIAPLILKDKDKGADPVALLQTLVALSEEVGKIHTRNVKSVNEQKYETFERHMIAQKLEDFLSKIGKNVRDADGDFDMSGVERQDDEIEGVIGVAPPKGDVG